jgi:putative oxidoreductase
MGFFENPNLARFTHAALRIIIGLNFMTHGAQKMFGAFGGVDGHGTAVPLAGLFGVAAILELVGGFLILIGLFTRPVAFILAGEMAVAYFMVHVSQGGIIPVVNHGEPAVLHCFVFLFLAFNGPGPLSVDDARRRRPVT